MSTQNSPPTAVILCGGQGTRLRPVIGDLPKCLAPVAGKPFLEYILNHLISQGVRTIVLCTGVGHTAVSNYVRDRCPIELHQAMVYCCKEEKPLGTGGALRNAFSSHYLASDPVLVMNGDTFCDFDLDILMKDYALCDHLWLGGEWKTIITLECGNSTASSGVRLASKALIESIPKDTLYHVNGFWGMAIKHKEWSFHDIGTPDGYASAEDFLRKVGVIR